jgi:hypothetical protein
MNFRQYLQEKKLLESKEIEVDKKNVTSVKDLLDDMNLKYKTKGNVFILTDNKEYDDVVKTLKIEKIKII